MSNSRTIAIKDYSHIREEATAEETIKPGHLVEYSSVTTVQLHSTAQGTALRMFALENDLQGKGIDDAYSSGSLVQLGIFRSGDRVNAILADGERAVAGARLVSNGDGCLKVYDTTSAEDAPQCLVGFAAESLDLSGSSGEESTGLQGSKHIEIIVA